MVRVCAWCEIGMGNDAKNGMVTHGICESCFRDVVTQLPEPFPLSDACEVPLASWMDSVPQSPNEQGVWHHQRVGGFNGHG